MKRLYRILFIIMIAILGFSAFAFVGCASSDEKPSDGGNGVVSSLVPEKPSDEKPAESGTPIEDADKEATKVFITINGKKVEMTLAKNATAAALAERLEKGDITYIADDYGGFEKVGRGLSFDLPTSDERITTKTGDVVLYAGDKIVIFYGGNTWEYTRLGRIEGTASELKEFLAVGTNGVTVNLSLTK